MLRFNEQIYLHLFHSIPSHYVTITKKKTHAKKPQPKPQVFYKVNIMANDDLVMHLYLFDSWAVKVTLFLIIRESV